MTNYYERGDWLPEARGLNASSSLFQTLSFILGLIGLLFAFILLIVAFASDWEEGRLSVLISAIVIGFQSVLAILFASMMRGLSKILLAVFEMSVSETRNYIEQQKQGEQA